MTWHACRLGDVVTLKRGHDLPDSQRQEGEVPVVSSSGITGHHSEPKAKAPGVVTGRYGTLGEVFYIEEDYWPLNTALYVTDFKGNQPRFVAYLLEAVLRDYQSDKAAVPGVNRNVLHELEIRCPSPTIQERISEILSAYDDLIENNRRRVALLEEAAQQLYREWFVRLRFPGHEHTRITNSVPEGWRRVPLGDCVTLHYGKALKAEDRSDGPFAVYGSSGVVGTHAKAFATAPGIVVGRKGNVGSVYWCPKDYWPIDKVYFVDSESSSLWLFYALRQMHFISTDVAVPGLNRDFAYSRPLLVPQSRIVRDFLDVAVPLHEQIAKLDEMNDKLRAARDLLLPRLMSGRIEV
jgi:type I restriction enzyme S subunit